MATSFTRTQASEHAIKIVIAALGSGVVKLSGPAGGPEQFAEDDAKYLAKLVNVLAEGIKDPNFK